MYIALIGEHGVGKTTVATILRHMGFEVRSLATPLKDTLSKLVGRDMSDDACKPLIYAPLGITYAQLLERYGEGMKQILYPQVWIDMFYANTVSKWPVVCDDLYSREEYDACKAHGGYVILITRPGVHRQDGRPTPIPLPFDYAIHNDGDYQSLVNQVRYRVGDIELQVRGP